MTDKEWRHIKEMNDMMFKCSSKENSNRHHFVLPTNVLLNGKREYDGTCKLCGYTRTHRFADDPYAKGRQAMKIRTDKARAKKAKENND